MLDISDIEKNFEKKKADFFADQKKQADHTLADPDAAMKSMLIQTKAQSAAKAKEREKPYRQGYRISLRVRKYRLSAPNIFVYESSKLSRVEAEIDARKAATAAGWPLVSCMIDIESLS